MSVRTVKIVYFGIMLAASISVGAMAAEKSSSPTKERIATFAGGCFWCVESDFDHVPGVLRTISGYTGGKLKNPTYQSVSRGGTGHREAVQIIYDPKKVTYAALLEVFWRSVDPTDNGGQFCDRGDVYETAIFTNSDEQNRLAEASKLKLQQSGILERPIMTPIKIAGPFYAAETYHQDYYKKNPLRYKFYRFRCGREARIGELWGKDAHRGITKN